MYKSNKQIKNNVPKQSKSILFGCCVLGVKNRFKEVFKYLEVVLNYYTKN